MKTKEEISEKIEKLNERIVGIKAEDEETLTNELKVILAGTELQSIMLTSILQNDEEKIRDLLNRFTIREDELNEKYVAASESNNQAQKNQVHGMIWTNDIRIDTLKWVLDEEEEI